MKKIIFLLLSGAMIMSNAACAQDNDAWKNNIGTINLDTMAVTGSGISVSNSTISISKGGDFEVKGTLSDGMIYVEADDKVKLRLSGASITNSDGPAIYFSNVDKGFITITENTENFLTDSKEYSNEEADAALFSNDDLEIKGAGTLTISANYKHGIASDDDLSVENGAITITSYEHGIKANNTINILGGDIKVTTQTGKGIKAEEALVIDAGKIDITTLEDEGIESKGILTINGGDINIISAEDGINTGSSSSMQTDAATDGTTAENEKTSSFGGDGEASHPMTENKQRPSKGQRPEMAEGEELPEGGQMPQRGGRSPQGEMPTDGEKPQRRGRVSMGEMPTDGEMPQMPEGENAGGMMPGGRRGGGFGMVDEETAAAHAITINGGNIYINAKGDGIDSNGNLIITGGTVIIDGPENNGNGPIDSQGNMSITGGEVITLSNAGMLQLPRNSEGQNVLRVLFEESCTEGDVVSVKDSSGNEIMTHTAAVKSQALIYSSSKLETDKEYSIYINGELYDSVTITQGTTSLGKGGMMMPGGRGFGGERQNGRGQEQSQNQITSNNKINVYVDGQQARFDTEPVIKNDTTLVGFRAILELLGAEVNWDEATKTVTAKKDGINITLTINSDKAYVNGEEKTLITAPEIINDSTMIPVRFISEQLGMNVAWNQDTRLINVTSRGLM